MGKGRKLEEKGQAHVAKVGPSVNANGHASLILILETVPNTNPCS